MSLIFALVIKVIYRLGKPNVLLWDLGGCVNELQFAFFVFFYSVHTAILLSFINKHLLVSS